MINDIDVFVADFKQWWDSFVGKSEESGSWDCLVCPGQNGLISILACLAWWFGKEGCSERWEQTISDVLAAFGTIERSGNLRQVIFVLWCCLTPLLANTRNHLWKMTVLQRRHVSGARMPALVFIAVN